MLQCCLRRPVGGTPIFPCQDSGLARVMCEVEREIDTGTDPCQGSRQAGNDASVSSPPVASGTRLMHEKGVHM